MSNILTAKQDFNATEYTDLNQIGGKRPKVPLIDATAHNEIALSPAQQLGSLGGAARARNLTAEQRSEIAQKAAAKRWER